MQEAKPPLGCVTRVVPLYGRPPAWPPVAPWSLLGLHIGLFPCSPSCSSKVGLLAKEASREPQPVLSQEESRWSWGGAAGSLTQSLETPTPQGPALFPCKPAPPLAQPLCALRRWLPEPPGELVRDPGSWEFSASAHGGARGGPETSVQLAAGGTSWHPSTSLPSSLPPGP